MSTQASSADRLLPDHRALYAPIADRLAEAVRVAPRRQRRLLSKTFWAQFGMKSRTADRVTIVGDLLHARGLHVSAAGTFGSEPRDTWITLSLLEPELPAPSPPPPPDDAWFATIQARSFESEREVEYYFVVPLLTALGYAEDDICIGTPVQMYEGVRRVVKEADCVVFDGTGRGRDDAVLVVEAKRPGRRLNEDAIGQARAYAIWLATPFYLVTNGDELRIYLFRGATRSDVLLVTTSRGRLREDWTEIWKSLGRTNAVGYKHRQPL